MKSFLSIAVLVLFAAVPHAEEPVKAVKATPNLDAIKKLAGDWYEVDKDGKVTDKLISQIRVTAGGSAVRDTIFPNTDMEMVSIYTQEGPDLFMTHYCVLRNAPKLKAETGTSPNAIVFKCVGGANVDLEKSTFMGKATLTVLDADHITIAGEKCENGKYCECGSMKLARKK